MSRYRPALPFIMISAVGVLILFTLTNTLPGTGTIGPVREVSKVKSATAHAGPSNASTMPQNTVDVGGSFTTTRPMVQEKNATAATSSLWISFSRLPPPPANVQISFYPEGSRVIAFSYDGLVQASNLIRTTDPKYPDANSIKITAFLHSQILVHFPLQADVEELEVSAGETS